MCAIFGIVGKSDPNLLKKISMSQLYRGPDSQEMYFDENKLFCFGNNRLAVIDKKGGNQPMFSEDKSIVIVFNGAIYNFKEINYVRLDRGKWPILSKVKANLKSGFRMYFVTK